MKLQSPPARWLSRMSGQNFVLLHGLVLAPAFWRLYAPSHVLEHNTVAYPLPGHDRWRLPVAGMKLSTEMIVDAYAEAIRRDFDRPVTLVGHSTGGFVSLLLAARHPELVRSVVLMGGFACGRFEGRERIAARLIRVPGIGGAMFRTLFSHWLSSAERFHKGSIDCVYDKTCPWEDETTRSMIEEVRLRLRRCRTEDIASVISWFQRTSILDQISSVTMPVLNLVGVNDEVVPPLHQLGVSRLLPNAHTVLFGATGHLLMVERPADLNRVFARFVSAPWPAAVTGSTAEASAQSRTSLTPSRGWTTRFAAFAALIGTKAPQAH